MKQEPVSRGAGLPALQGRGEVNCQTVKVRSGQVWVRIAKHTGRDPRQESAKTTEDVS